MAGDRQRALAAGFDEHLAKPAGLEEIQRVIERLARDP
jgi:CheY-like chemotaxis protein